jgi:hypothetical protein
MATASQKDFGLAPQSLATSTTDRLHHGCDRPRLSHLGRFDASSTFVVVHPNADVYAAPIARESLTLGFRVRDIDVR